VSVVQPYLQCQPTLQSAFITAAGLAAANAALLSAVFLGLAIPIVIQYFNSLHGNLRLISPSQKALHAEHADKRLLADNASLRAELKTHDFYLAALRQDNAEMRARDSALWVEFTALKLVLTQQNPALAQALETATKQAFDAIPPAASSASACAVPALSPPSFGGPSRLTVPESVLQSQSLGDNPLHAHSQRRSDPRRLL